MIKLLTVEDYKRYQEGMNKTLYKINEDLDLALHIYHCDNAFVFEEAQITKDDIVLDIGCGAGSSSVQAAYFARKVIGMDRECHHKEYGEYKAKGIDNVCFDCPQEATRLEYPNNYFDKIISISALEHNNQEDRIKIMKECARVLKPGGTVTMSVGVGKNYILDDVQISDMIHDAKLVQAAPSLTKWHINWHVPYLVGWQMVRNDLYEKTYQDWMDFLGYDQGWIPCGFKAIKEK